MEDTVRRDLKAWNINQEFATDRRRLKGVCMLSARPATVHCDMVVKDVKGDEMRVTILIIVCHAGKWYVRLPI